MRDINHFEYQGQEEDHYTNVLLSILELDHEITKVFIQTIIPHEAGKLEFKYLIINTRYKKCPQEAKVHEYIIGIAPYQERITNRNIYNDNSGSIPDAWICGENFNLLFEFKLRGKLDESQLAANKKLLGENSQIIRLTWENVIKALQHIIERNPNTLYSFLFEQLLFLQECLGQRVMLLECPNR